MASSVDTDRVGREATKVRKSPEVLGDVFRDILGLENWRCSKGGSRRDKRPALCFLSDVEAQIDKILAGFLH